MRSKIVSVVVLHLALLALHLADLGLTSTVSPDREANPLAGWAWALLGFGSLIGLKLACWLFMLIYHLVVRRLLPRLERWVWVGMLSGAAAMTGLLVWNIHVL
jgi:hypothetical protein